MYIGSVSFEWARKQPALIQVNCKIETGGSNAYTSACGRKNLSVTDWLASAFLLGRTDFVIATELEDLPKDPGSEG